MKSFTLIIIAFILYNSYSYASSKSDAEAARKSLAAYQCMIYADYAKKEEAEKIRLFEIGYKESIVFLEAVKNKNITEDDYKKIVPMVFSFSLAGPNKDFIAGRIYESISNDASDDIIKEDASGLPITDPMKWNMDKELQKMIAQNKYRKANCDLLK